MSGTANHRHLTERQLSGAARQVAILDAIPAHIAILDHLGHIISVNAAWRKFADANLLQTANHALGVNYLDVCDKAFGADSAEAPQVAEGIRSVLSGKAGSYSVEYPCHSPTEQRWFMMTATPLPVEPAGIIVMHSNITARRQAEDEVTRLNSSLEERVRQRTLQLQLANEELASFSYSVSHDLRTPLSALHGLSSLLGREADQGRFTERSKHYTERIKIEVVQMSDLIDKILLLAQLSQTELRWETVDLSAIAQKLADAHKELEPERPVQFDIQPGMLAKGDPILLHQVLENLLGNALKFSAKKPAQYIRFSRTAGNCGQDVYTVEDNGAGFNMAYSEKLFGAFQRLHTTSEFPGTGIGLATVHRIITRHGGKIWAESVLSQGARFSFTIGKEKP